MKPSAANSRSCVRGTRAIAEELLTPAAAQLYLAGLDRDCHDLLGVLHSVKLTRAAARNVTDLIAGYGEIWSTRLFERFSRSARAARAPCSGSMRGA